MASRNYPLFCLVKFVITTWPLRSILTGIRSYFSPVYDAGFRILQTHDMDCGSPLHKSPGGSAGCLSGINCPQEWYSFRLLPGESQGSFRARSDWYTWQNVLHRILSLLSIPSIGAKPSLVYKEQYCHPSKCTCPFRLYPGGIDPSACALTSRSIGTLDNHFFRFQVQLRCLFADRDVVEMCCLYLPAASAVLKKYR